jgi:hypothetical protein
LRSEETRTIDAPALTNDSAMDEAHPAAPAAGVDRAPRLVFRLRDLDRRARWVAVALALALALAPILAFAWVVPEWAPAGDPALMGLRALDVGTSHTPLIGQPSSSGVYDDATRSVSHLGPTHFYLLAAPVRLLGGDIGMPLVSIFIVGSCVLVAAWAVFRQLGPTAGVLAAVILGTITFTTGASSLVDPVSSNIAGYPLLCSAVLLWCVVCGDARLLPLTVGILSFTLQQHLSVIPSCLALTAGAAVATAVFLRRDHRWRRREVRRQWAAWGAWSALVGLLLWAPVLLQQLLTDDGNLSRLVGFAGKDRETLGNASALRQVVHALGLPPLLGNTRLTGLSLIAGVAPGTWVSAVAVVAVVAWLGARWWHSRPREAALAVMVGVAALAGLITGSSVPAGLERSRLVLYHWSFVVAFFTWLVLGLGVVELARHTKIARARAVVPALTALALLAIVVPAGLNPILDRPSNTLVAAHGIIEKRFVDRLTNAVLAHRDALGAQTLVVGRDEPFFLQYDDTLAFALSEHGIGVRLPRASHGFVNDGRLVDRDTVESAIVLVPESELHTATQPGRVVADVDVQPDFDVAAYRRLLAQARSGGEVHVGRAAEQAIEAIADKRLGFVLGFGLVKLNTDPARTLTRPVLEFLRDHPIESPRLDPRLIERTLATAPRDWTPQTILRIRLFLVDRAELLRTAAPGEL